MKPVDIRIMDDYEVDMNSFKDTPREYAESLFFHYDLALQRQQELRDNFTAKWVFSEGDELEYHWKEKDRVFFQMEHYKDELKKLNENPFNHKGLSLKKTGTFLFRTLTTPWFDFILCILYINLTIKTFQKDAPIFVLIMMIVLTLMFGYKAWKGFNKREKGKVTNVFD